MSIIIARIDDRLIHGQVTEGWGKRYDPDLYVVISDEVSGAEWQCELCLAALPRQQDGMVISLADAPRIINSLIDDPRRVFLLFESPHDVWEVVHNGATIETLNIGGMHSMKGKREIVEYIYVDDEDIRYLKDISDMGITFDVRDLPDHDKVDILSRL